MVDITELYFVARTDVTGDEGLQRVFGVFDTEDLAAAAGTEIAASHHGQFKVFRARAVLAFTKPAAPVQVVQVNYMLGQPLTVKAG
ncbi:hypothetical protein [Bradyrhizobium sp. 2S1]|uniref:hypothetical protein n=1 Tax=Bradyrhizobium sp. 2S1 TaxID=1404429 RepID=UPI00140A7633|nr:hypothetical protein [Bradyrhizobium sp. 2S1]MCK7670159.1 hypothetical protein [Bradyrhizobium sp. 2S1]